MKLKKVLSGFLSAAIVATSTAIVMPLSASAATIDRPEGIEKVLKTFELADGAVDMAQYASCWASLYGLSESDFTNSDNYIKVTFTTADALTFGGGGNTMGEITGWGWSSYSDWINAGNFYDTEYGTIKEAQNLAPATNSTDTSFYCYLPISDFNTDDHIAGNVQNYLPGTATLASVELVNISNAAPELPEYEYVFDTASGSAAAWGTAAFTAVGEDQTITNEVLTGDFIIVVPFESESNPNIVFTDQSGNDGPLNWIQTSPSLVVGQTAYYTKADILAKWEAAGGSSTFSELKAINVAAAQEAATVTDVALYSTAQRTVPVSDISLDVTELALIKGESETLTVTVEPAEADQDVKWTSSEPTVAKVDQTGKVTALKTGTATITVTSTADETKAAECEVTVTNLATAIAIPTTASVLVGKTQTLAVTTTPADADELTYTWATSDAAIVTVADGVVTGVAAGTAKITVTAGTLTASCDVTVTAEAKPITALTISDNTLELEEGETGTLTYTATPADNTDEIEWITSNADVATVKNGVVTAVAEGKATITVQVKGNETISASCEVTVTAKAPEIETKPYKLTVTDASSWGKPGVTKAAQINVPITTLNGFKVGTTTYKDIKNKTLKLENLGFGSCTLEGVEAENVEVSIYLQLGANWEHWCATADYTLADGIIEFDLSTLAAQGVKDTDVLQAIGFQFNIMGTVGGINDMTIGDNITLNAAEPKISVVGEEPPAEESDYDTGKVETVDDYVPAEAGTELVVRSITATQAAIYDSYTITVKDNNGKTYTTTTSDCYKAFKYNTASGEKTEEANGYFIIVKVTNVPAGTTVTVTIEPTK